MTRDDSTGANALGFEPENLDGHTMDELSDYLDAGRQPADPSIDASPGCRIALDALERLRRLGPALLDQDTAGEPQPDDNWVRSILDGIARDARAGRRIPFPVAEPDDDLGITEGAVRGLIRAAGDGVPGVLIGRCRLDGEVTTPGAPVRIEVEASVPYGLPISRLAERLRDEIGERLRTHTELNVTGIDIVVHDVRDLPSSGGSVR
ncbi:Asp23 family, cell envelope-related function [Microbacterium azadirachtae]|uniref:Asp23 family, cell envelope-related function n=1 Tax=Microbacterium azadirachtae TaxID=582680 RepID=A0A1I6HGP6_9MICO|nr:Asp23/Gls24 family envelope stress response protein [Microbacterium azadirachtae]SFR53663.1 Asp23 family, cell envelope-related function [Microbacterium azadirachtae]